MLTKFKKVFYFYQSAMWYYQIAANEAKKPLTLWNETALITIFLSTVLGYKPPFLWILGIYLFISCIFIIIGKILVVTGVQAYNQRLGNRQSPELMEILERVRKLEK